MASLDDAFNQLKIANQHLTAIDNDLQTVNASAKAVGVDSQATRLRCKPASAASTPW